VPCASTDDLNKDKDFLRSCLGEEMGLNDTSDEGLFGFIDSKPLEELQSHFDFDEVQMGRLEKAKGRSAMIYCLAAAIRTQRL